MSSLGSNILRSVSGDSDKSNGNGAENIVWQALQAQLKVGETLLRNVRFTDSKYGDVEIDFLILMPDAGIAVIEVKGGHVSFEGGQWISRSLSNPNWSRRIQPIEQARKAKHAVRRYLDRQTDWPYGLIRSAWFVAMPFTEVSGDMSPDGKREHLIGKSDLTSLRERIRGVLLDPLNADKLADQEWPDVALSLILRLEHANGDQQKISSTTTSSDSRIPRILFGLGLIGAFAVGLVMTALFTVRGGWIPAVILLAVFAGVVALTWHKFNASAFTRSLRKGVAIAGTLGIALGFSATLALYGEDVVQGECDPNYLPCIPIAEKLNCGDIKIAVRVVGTDIHSLDRDKNGTGCETYR
jgi:hypothetical protein